MGIKLSRRKGPAYTILAALAKSPTPVPTPQLVQSFGDGRPGERNRVWAALQWLRKQGLITQAVVGRGSIPARWKLAD